MLAVRMFERSEAPRASPSVLVKKPDGSYRICVNFKELNKMTVFDLNQWHHHMTYFQRCQEVSAIGMFDFCKGYWEIQMDEKYWYITIRLLSHLLQADEIWGRAVWYDDTWWQSFGEQFPLKMSWQPSFSGPDCSYSTKRIRRILRESEQLWYRQPRVKLDQVKEMVSSGWQRRRIIRHCGSD